MSLLKPQKTKTVEKLFKISQNGCMIFNFFLCATTSLCKDLDVPKNKTVAKLFKISQYRPTIINFLILPGGPHEGLRPYM